LTGAADAAHGQRYPKSDRLRTDREYREVVHKGQRTRSAHFTIYRDFPEGTVRKTGVSVGRRIGNAVVRNRVKRLIREFCRRNREAFPPGSRTAIVAKATPGAPSYSSVRDELLAAISGRWGLAG
jgi:ribonuclease P protein component